MMNKNEYIDKACETIVTLSADEEKRIEYEQRLKSIRDHNTQMSYNYNKGLEDGRLEGRQEGRLEGRQEGEHKLSSLIQLLLQDNRTDDIARVTSDETYREELYSEYNL